jgi:phage gp29-like protein
MLRKDAQLALCFRQRALNVMAQGWRVIPGGDTSEDKERAAWVEGELRRIRQFHISRTLFFRGISHGFSPAEIMFERRGDGTIGIDSFRNRDPERFRFDPDGTLLLTDMPGDPKVLPRWKFVLNTWGSDESPYGQGLLREIYPLWFFKNNAVKELVRFVEKFGAPYLWASYPRGTSGPEQDSLLEVLKLMQSNTVGIGPEGTEFQINEVGRQGVVEVFRFIISEYVDRQYAKAILGQTLSTESESGTHALARFQRMSLQNIIEDDSQWQQEQLDGVIRTLVEINFGPLPAGRYPRFRIAYEEDRDLAAYLKAVGVAVNELGLEVGENWLREQIGFPAPQEDDSALAGSSQDNREEEKSDE